ncbi:MAG: hypothetical protein LR017_03320 [Candidatus Pacebacteria bacterium]|nr:hypothetical protein [Candidatus Paceibacterota bacterium]
MVNKENSALSDSGIAWLPKKSHLPLLWRWIYPWRIIKVTSEIPYHVHFKADTWCMKTAITADTEYVAVRIGRDAISFLCTDATGLLSLAYTWHTEKYYSKKQVEALLGDQVTFV